MGKITKDLPHNKVKSVTFRCKRQTYNDLIELSHAERTPMAVIVCNLVEKYIEKKRKDGKIQ